MWGFETAVHARMPHCVLHTLDCTVKLRVPASLRGVVVPHQICLGAENGEQDSNGGKVQFMTWRSFAAHINLDRPPVALKMDIEGYEIELLNHLLDEDAIRNVNRFKYDLLYIIFKAILITLKIKSIFYF